MKSKQEWGWDSGLLRHRIMKSLGIPETANNKNKTILGVLAESDDILDHLPFRISDVVLNTDKFAVIAEMLSHPKNSIFWQTISQSDNIFLFCDPHRPVDNCLVFAASRMWWNDNTEFQTERKSITAKIISYNKRHDISAFACLM